MKKILYVMHVEWNLIKQRPHFIAEELSKLYNVKVIFRFQFDRGKMTKEKRDKNIIPLFVIPFERRFSFIHKMNKILLKLMIRFIISLFAPDYLYLMLPAHIDYIPSSFKGKVIYDCMDDYASFVDNYSYNKKILLQESAMIKRADIVFVSSRHLYNKLLGRYGKNNIPSIHVIRNAYSSRISSGMNNTVNSPTKSDGHFVITYFGTVSRWFDFDIIKKSIQDFPNIKYKIIGIVDPMDTVFTHDRVEYVGVVSHDKLYDITKDTDCFVMPFIVNELVLSVDPVKIYEYIDFGKNILCVRYPEVERFRDFVFFYSDYEEYAMQVQYLQKNREIKYSTEQRENFLKENTWEKRVNEISNIIEKST